MAPTKGKAGTKGSKQIKEENQQTYDFYLKAIVAVQVLPSFLLLWNFENTYWLSWALLIGPAIIYSLCMSTVKSMLASGLDINADSGVAEHIKDIIGITAICQLLSCITNYFWLLWLVVPAAALMKLWKSILAPWIFQEGPPELTEKQKKKMERKNYKRM